MELNMILGLLSERDAYNIGHNVSSYRVISALYAIQYSHISNARVLVQSCMIYVNTGRAIVLHSARQSEWYGNGECYGNDGYIWNKNKKPMYHKNTILY